MRYEKSPVIRPGKPEDALPWAQFLARCQGRTYQDLIPGDFGSQQLAGVSEAAERLATRLAEDDAVRDRVAECEGEIVGVVAAGPAPSPWEVELGLTPAPSDWQLQRLYVHHDWHGSGLADRLLASVVDDRPCYLWIIDGNARAQRFYRRHGFEDLPERIPAGESWGSVPMHRMVRRSGAAA